MKPREFAVLITSTTSLVLFLLTGPHLIVGWLLFPINNVPLMTMNLPSLSFSCAMFIVFVVLLKQVLRWWSTNSDYSPTAICRLSRYSTALAMTALIMLLFVSGTSLVAIGHQAIWLVTGHRDTKPSPPLGFPGQAKLAAERSQTKNQLWAIGLATLNYGSNRNRLPPGGTWTEDGRQLHGWYVYVGPYSLIDTRSVDFDIPWHQPPNDRLFRCGIPDLWIPGVLPRFDPNGFGLSHFAMNSRIMVQETPRKFDQDFPQSYSAERGSSNTILAGEAAGDFRPWGSPHNVRDPLLGLCQSPQGFGTPTADTATLFVMADGSVRSIANNVDPDVFTSLAIPTARRH